jgi:hypothetical protein
MQGANTSTLAEVQIGNNMALDGDWVYVTTDRALRLANIQIVAENRGLNNDSLPGQAAKLRLVNGYPIDLLVTADDLVQDSGPITITVKGLDQNSSPQTGTALFETPAYAGVADQILKSGWAADVVPTVPTSQWTAFNGFSISCAAAARGAKFSIWGMPNLSDHSPSNYQLIGTTNERSIKKPRQASMLISDGMNQAAFDKPGMKHPGEMRVKLRHDAMGRFNLASVTVRVDMVKEQKIVTKRLYVLDGTMIEKSAGAFDATIMFNELAIMFAQSVGSPME